MQRTAAPTTTMPTTTVTTAAPAAAAAAAAACNCSSREAILSPLSLTLQLSPPLSWHQGCGYENGEELLSVYTMAQSSFSLFFSVVVLMAMCMAWKVDQDDIDDRKVGVICKLLAYSM